MVNAHRWPPAPSSSASRRTPVRQIGPTDGSDNGLFFPASPIATTPRANRRGDIHSNAAFSTPTRRQYTPRAAPSSQANVPSSTRRHDLRDPSGFPSSAPIDFPSSLAGSQAVPAPSLSAQAVKSEAEDLTRVIWGTNVSLSESMTSFTNFMRNFKTKYRVSWDRDHGLSVPALSSPEEGEQLLYEDYLRTMRVTGQTNLNLDMVNLQAFPPTKKLYTQLIKYPQEIIPVMDQVLKDLMIAVAEEDQQVGVEGMQGDEGEDEINEMMSKVYKIRPWGGDTCNMRDLNPAGDTAPPLFEAPSIYNLSQIPTNSSQLKASSFAQRQLFQI
jgi:DNA replication licensing factor MCM4